MTRGYEQPRSRSASRPRGGVGRVDGVVADGDLRVRVRRRPSDGAANEALRRACWPRARWLPREFGACRIDRRARPAASKRVAVDGVEPEALVARWPGLARMIGPTPTPVGDASTSRAIGSVG